MPIRLTQVGNLVRYPMVVFNSMQKIAAQVEVPAYRDFYESARANPNPARFNRPVLTG